MLTGTDKNIEKCCKTHQSYLLPWNVFSFVHDSRGTAMNEENTWKRGDTINYREIENGIYVIEKIPTVWLKKEFWMESTHENYFSLTSAFSWSASLCSSCWISAFLRWIVEVIFRKEIFMYVYKRIRGWKTFMSLSSYSMKTCNQP